MKTYQVRIVGNDTFDRTHEIQVVSMEEAVKVLPAILDAFGQWTIEQFVEISVREVANVPEVVNVTSKDKTMSFLIVPKSHASRII